MAKGTEINRKLYRVTIKFYGKKIGKYIFFGVAHLGLEISLISKLFDVGLERLYILVSVAFEDGVEEKILTADLIEKATPVVIKNDLCFGDLCFTKEKGTINKKILLQSLVDASVKACL